MVKSLPSPDRSHGQVVNLDEEYQRVLREEGPEAAAKYAEMMLTPEDETGLAATIFKMRQVVARVDETLEKMKILKPRADNLVEETRELLRKRREG